MESSQAVAKFPPITGEVLEPSAFDFEMANTCAGFIGAIIVLDNLDRRYMVKQDGNIFMWSTEGHRITFGGSGLTIVVTRTKDVDPYYPGRPL